MTRLKSIAILFPLTLFLAACQFSLAADVTPPPNYTPAAPPAAEQPAALTGPTYPLVAPNPADGQALYAEKCAPCHGPNGKGDGPRASQLPNPVAAIGDPELARQSLPSEWFRIVTQGNLERFMPPFPSLTDRQRWDVLAYVYSLSAPQGSVAHGGELYAANCARCHGSTGKGDGSDAAGLATPPTDLTNQEWMAGKSEADFFNAATNGVPPAMPAFNQLSESDRWDLAAYVRSLPFAVGGPLAQAGTPVPGVGATTPVTATTGLTSTASLTGTLPLTSTTPLSVTGVVSGTIVNASGGAVPAGLEVFLHGFDQMQTAFTQTVTTEAGGHYVFPSVPLPAGRVFLTTVRFNGATYGSDVYTVQGSETEVSLPITVYETTSDTSVLSVDRLHLFFEPVDDKTMRVIELYIISNPSTKTVTAAEEGQPTLTYQLPPGATNLEFQDGQLGGGRYVQTENGFGDVTAIRPGQSAYQVLFAFEMPYNKELDLEQTVPLPTNAVVILVPDQAIKVKGDNLQDAGTRDVQGASYHMYNGSALAAGQVVRVSVSASAPGIQSVLSTGSQSSLLLGLGALGVVLIVAGALLFLRQRSLNALEDEDEALEEAPPVTGPETPESLMDAILALDDMYRSGELPEAAYQQRRTQLKARLKELLG